MYARQPLMRLPAESAAARRTWSALMYPLTPLTDLVMTRNHEALARAVEQFDGRKFDYTPQEPVRGEVRQLPGRSSSSGCATRCRCRRCKALVTHMGSLREGRKAVILVSEGYTELSAAADARSDREHARPRQPGAPFARRRGAGEDRERFFSSAEMISDLKQVYDVANRNNTAIYALDPRGLAAFEFDINEGVGASACRRGIAAHDPGHAAHPQRRDGRPRHREPERSRQGHCGRSSATRAPTT